MNTVNEKVTHIRAVIKRLGVYWLRDIYLKNSDFKTETLLMFGLLGILIMYFVFFLWHSIILIFYPYRLTHGEVSLLFESVLLSRGENIYKDMSISPYIVSLYTPIYPLLCSFLIKIFGSLYVGGRLISFFASILVGIFIFKITRLKSIRFEGAIFASLFFFASHFVFSWVPLARVDILGIMFSIIGIYYVSLYEKDKPNYIYAATLLFVLAAYTKQSLIAAPAASYLYLLFKDRKIAIKAMVMYVSLGVLIFLVLNITTGGHFYKHTFGRGDAPYSLILLFGFWYKTLIVYPVVIGLVLFYINRCIADKKISLLLLYFLFAFLTSLTSGFKGAWINHSLEMFTVLCVLLGLSIHFLIIEYVSARKLILIMLLVQLLVIFHMPYLPSSIQKLYLFYHFTPIPDKKELLACKKISSYIKNSKGEVLSLTNGDFCVVNGKDMYIETVIFEKMNVGDWDPSPLAKDIDERKFSLIVLNDWTSKLGKLINEKIKNNYELIDKISFQSNSSVLRGGGDYNINNYRILKPK